MSELALRATWRDYLKMCKPRVVVLMLLCAVVGMFLATPNAQCPGLGAVRESRHSPRRGLCRSRQPCGGSTYRCEDGAYRESSDGYGSSHK